MKANQSSLHAVKILYLVVTCAHLTYESYVTCKLGELCMSLEKCQEILHRIHKDKPEEIGEIVTRELCNLTESGVKVCCPKWQPLNGNICDKYLKRTTLTKGAYPWQAKLIYMKRNNESEVEPRCSGSLIAKDYVLTAAHCNTVDWKLVEIWLGDDKKSIDTQIPVESFVQHPKFHQENHYAYDIGLVKLRFPVNINLVLPACLSGGISSLLEKEKFIIIGTNGKEESLSYAGLTTETMVEFAGANCSLTKGDSGTSLIHKIKRKGDRTQYHIFGVYIGFLPDNNAYTFTKLDSRITSWITQSINNIQLL